MEAIPKTKVVRAKGKGKNKKNKTPQGSRQASAHPSRAPSPPAAGGGKQRKERRRLTDGEKKFNMLKKYSNMKLEKGAYNRTVLALYKKNVRYVFDPVPNNGEGEWKKYTTDVLHVKPRAVKINRHRRGHYTQWGKIIGPIGYPGAYKDGAYVRKRKR